MEIDLNYLKFHSFKFNKNWTNFVKKNYKWDNFWRLLNKKLLHIKNLEDNFFNNRPGSNDHFLDEDHFNILVNKIIKKCHPALKNDLMQLMEGLDQKKIHNHFYQFHLENNSCEVIFILYYEKKQIKYFVPLLLDLNHSIYKISEEKPYAYKFEKSWKDWNWKCEQEKTKQRIENKLNS